MATVAHTIHSHYDPKDRERLERETGQIPDELDPEQHWRKESLQVYPKKSLAPAPVFVPAKVADGEWASYATSPTLVDSTKRKESDVSGWYRDLVSKSMSNSPQPSPAPTPTPGPSRLSQPTPPTNHDRQPKKPSTRDKNNWFIQNVISSSAPPSTPSTPLPFSISSAPPAAPAPAPTLAEILEREPPSKEKDKVHKPPVWIALGPANKGFGLLQKSGWNEGEALGPYAQRRAVSEGDVVSFLDSDGDRTQSKGKEKELDVPSRVEYISVPAGKTRKRARQDSTDDQSHNEIIELRRVEIVDLTLSDDEHSAAEEPENASSQVLIKQEAVDEVIHNTESGEGHGGTALLTPLSTVLKVDKLGIGLKPKLTSASSSHGAYRVPVLKSTPRNDYIAAKGFRVTSTQGVLDEIKRREQEEKREREIWGRGRRGKERKRRKEAEERKGLLAYMNE